MSIFLKMWNKTEKRQEQFLWAARQLNQKEKRVHSEFFLIFFAKISISTSSLCECKMQSAWSGRSIFVHRRRKIIIFVLNREWKVQWEFLFCNLWPLDEYEESCNGNAFRRTHLSVIQYWESVGTKERTWRWNWREGSVWTTRELLNSYWLNCLRQRRR